MINILIFLLFPFYGNVQINLIKSDAIFIGSYDIYSAKDKYSREVLSKSYYSFEDFKGYDYRYDLYFLDSLKISVYKKYNQPYNIKKETLYEAIDYSGYDKTSFLTDNDKIEIERQLKEVKNYYVTTNGISEFKYWTKVDSLTCAKIAKLSFIQFNSGRMTEKERMEYEQLGKKYNKHPHIYMPIMTAVYPNGRHTYIYADFIKKTDMISQNKTVIPIF